MLVFSPDIDGKIIVVIMLIGHIVRTPDKFWFAAFRMHLIECLSMRFHLSEETVVGHIPLYGKSFDRMDVWSIFLPARAIFPTTL